ncbi:MAG: RluA family pseudouridine synthase [Rickettsiales bacterium]|jgi:23S rRNA pseudouridine955/2504/2580 synthase|nr:RluA family pseudouridine synthase [Rickettsiales bacterium]
MSGKIISLVVDRTQEDMGLDRFLRVKYPNGRITDIWKFIRKREITVNGMKVGQNYRLRSCDLIRFSDFVEKVLRNPLKCDRGGTDRTVDRSEEKDVVAMVGCSRLLMDNIIYEDDDLLVIDKPYGLPVQGGTSIGMSVDRMLKNISSGGGQPRLVHRLDRYTTGVLIMAKNPSMAKGLAKIFRSRENIRKEYLLIAKGQMARTSSSIDYPLTKKYESGVEKVYVDRLGGQEALTNYSVLSYSRDYDLSFVRAEIVTGRTHQIRVHFREIGSPLLGDFKYGGEDAGGGITTKLQLHSHRATLKIFQREHMFVARIPKHMEKILDRVFGNWREFL